MIFASATEAFDRYIREWCSEVGTVNAAVRVIWGDVVS
jgi:hypothetical protein